MRTTLHLSIALASLAAIPSGCAAPSSASEAGAGARYDESALAQDLVMESIRTGREAGRLSVSFDLVNRRPTTHGFEWTIHWLDARGATIGGAGPWTALRLAPAGRETLTATAADPEASGFRLGLRALR